MGRNLTNLPISASFQYLTQISGSELTDGLGVDIDSLNLDITGTASTASYVAGANVDGTVATATSASYATTASFALNVTDPTLQDVTDAGNTTTNDLRVNNASRTATYSGDGISNNGTDFTIIGGTTTNGDLILKANDTSDVTVELNGDTDTVIITGDVSGSGYVSASAFIGDGSQLTGISTDPFPYTGSAEITGSLTVDGDVNITGSIKAQSTTSVIITGHPDNIATGTRSVCLGGGNNGGGDRNEALGNETAVIGGHNNTANGDQAGVAFGKDTSVSATQACSVGGRSHSVTGVYGGTFAGYANTVSHARSVVLGGTGLSTSKDDEVVVPSLTATDISASAAISASTYYGDGSNLTGIDTDPFPYTGSAEITGSLDVEGNVTLGGPNNSITSTGAYNVILNDSGSISGTVRSSFIAAGGVESTNTISAGLRNALIATRGNTIQGGAETCAIIAGLSNTINAGTGVRQAVIIGSRSSSITGGSFYGQAILGARSGTLSGPNAVLIGGQDNTISGESAGIFAGYNHTVSALTSAALGGRSATVSHQDSVVLGGDGLSTQKTQEAVVEHLSIYGDTFISSSALGTGSLIDNLGQESIVTGSQVQHIVNLSQTEYDALTPDANTLYVIDGSEVLSDTVVSGSLIGEVTALSISSNTASLDCSTGNFFTLTLVSGSDTHLDPSNIQTGQTINLKLSQPTSAADSHGTISFGSEFEFEGGTAFTATAVSGSVDVLTFVSFDGTSLQTVGAKNFS